MKKSPSPNWLEMPHELMANIFQRLPTIEILMSARHVCTTWRRICTDPAIWKIINIYKMSSDWNANYNLEILTKQAVDLSCGELIDISIGGFGNDDLLEHIVKHSKKLKSLCLLSCFGITGTVLSVAVKRLPHLEKLHLGGICIDEEDQPGGMCIDAEAIEVIGRNCPQLNSFTMSSVSDYSGVNDDQALAIAKNMPELRHLKLVDSNMTNDGLQNILNGCPHLQSLDVRMGYDLDLSGELGKLCMERIKDFKHHSTEYSPVEFSEGDSYECFLSEDDYYEDWIL